MLFLVDDVLKTHNNLIKCDVPTIYSVVWRELNLLIEHG
jgi:hypothetical protein